MARAESQQQYFTITISPRRWSNSSRTIYVGGGLSGHIVRSMIVRPNADRGTSVAADPTGGGIHLIHLDC